MEWRRGGGLDFWRGVKMKMPLKVKEWWNRGGERHGVEDVPRLFA